jgi:hypothetical protein
MRQAVNPTWNTREVTHAVSSLACWAIMQEEERVVKAGSSSAASTRIAPKGEATFQARRSHSFTEHTRHGLAIGFNIRHS